jgi:hypothetical protein
MRERQSTDLRPPVPAGRDALGIIRGIRRGRLCRDESGWHHRKSYSTSGPSLRARWAKVDPALRARGHAGNRRLYSRWQGFTERKKNPLVANVAVARELSGWCWSLATM